MASSTIRSKINLSWDFFFLLHLSSLYFDSNSLFSIKHRILGILTYLGLFQYVTDKFPCYNESCLLLSSLKENEKPFPHLSCTGQPICLVVWTLVPIWHSFLFALWGSSEFFLGSWWNYFIKMHCGYRCFNYLVMPGNLFLCKCFFFFCFFPACFQSFNLYKNLENLDLSWSVFSHSIPEPGKCESRSWWLKMQQRNNLLETEAQEGSRAAATSRLKGHALGSCLRGPSSCQQHHGLQSPVSKCVIFWPAVTLRSPFNSSRTQSI